MGKILCQIEEFLPMRSAFSSIFCLIRANIVLSLTNSRPSEKLKRLMLEFYLQYKQRMQIKSNKILQKALCQNFCWTTKFTNHRDWEGSKFCLIVNAWTNMYSYVFYLIISDDIRLTGEKRASGEMGSRSWSSLITCFSTRCSRSWWQWWWWWLWWWQWWWWWL